MVSTISSFFRGKQRIILIGLALTTLLVFLFQFSDDQLKLSSISDSGCIIAAHSTSNTSTSTPRKYNYLNLNNLNSTTHGRQAKERILVLTLLQNDQDYLDNYFDLLDISTYPNKLISIGLLVSDSSDNTLQKLSEKVQILQTRWRHKFHEIDIFQRDFEIDKRPDDITLVLDSKRAALAKAKNFLLAAALKEYHSWVVWIDVKLHSYPATIFSDLMLADADVVVPNCLQYREDNEFWAFDRNNWQESDLSLKKQQDLDQNEILMEDYNEFAMGRHLLVDMPSHNGLNYKVPLDGVGTTFTMVKATVHREGAIFPPFIYQHHLDNEGFAKMVKSMGFTIYGIPGYSIYHF
ncbi:hypothetical protein CU098_006104 [Rhizopus stolonifer]|uniref:Golgi mannosyltransferase complex subunit n=1 Tax=Rhizopus stolonifer TaxID=4846 RepID=A0A367JU34_RHIST|nr:hypothetical protein CU098_006104 [Rhizopus stolonifer]